MRSVLLDALGRSQEARQALEYGRDADPRDVRFRLGLAQRYLQSRDQEAAAKELTAAIDINGRDLNSRRQLAAIRVQQERWDAAIQQFQELLRFTPNDPPTLFNLAYVYRRSGDTQQAIDTFRNVLTLRSDFLPAANNLAWLLATHPDDSIRDGEEALRVAQAMCEQTKFSNPSLLDTLAAAYAEVGDFDNAVRSRSNGPSNWRKRRLRQKTSQPWSNVWSNIEPAKPIEPSSRGDSVVATPSRRELGKTTEEGAKYAKVPTR